MTNIATTREAVRSYSRGAADPALWELVDSSAHRVERMAGFLANAIDELQARQTYSPDAIVSLLGDRINDNAGSWTSRAGEADVLRRHAGGLAKACVMAAMTMPDVATGDVEAVSIVQSALARFGIDGREDALLRLSTELRDQVVRAIVGSLHAAGRLVAPTGHTLDETIGPDLAPAQVALQIRTHTGTYRRALKLQADAARAIFEVAEENNSWAQEEAQLADDLAAALARTQKDLVDKSLTSPSPVIDAAVAIAADVLEKWARARGVDPAAAAEEPGS